MSASKYVDDYEVKEFQDAKWLHVFFHNSTNFEYFNKSDVFLSLDNTNKFSILKYLPFVKTFEKRCFEFLLEYPGYSGFNRWKQTSNPTTSRTVTGFSANETDLTWSSNFKGLRRREDDTNALIVGAAPGTWFFAIGAYRFSPTHNVNGTFPGPNLHVSKVSLWVRVSHFSNMICFDKCTIICKRQGISNIVFAFLYGLIMS